MSPKKIIALRRYRSSDASDDVSLVQRDVTQIRRREDVTVSRIFLVAEFFMKFTKRTEFVSSHCKYGSRLFRFQ